MADRYEASALREECDALSNENCRLRVTANHQSSTIGELVSQNARLLTERDALVAQVDLLTKDREVLLQELGLRRQELDSYVVKVTLDLLERNQCDGCAVQAPLTDRGNHQFKDGSFMGCTADRYKRPNK